MAGLIDPAAEAERLSKRIARTQQDLAKVRAQLDNADFVRNAPEALVTAQRERASELERTLSSLSSQLARVRGMLGPDSSAAV